MNKSTAEKHALVDRGLHQRTGSDCGVPIARPRDKRTIIHHPVWTELLDRLLYMLESEYHQDV
ncbi:hypothetical protein [Luteitalea sp.]|uniref:hypothetical protein n=1 Tax=Luteitalea sp. TaxID=2004800 RepID=UPI0025B7A981|nr:hypothetical protein [Luteitalea sp.]